MTSAELQEAVIQSQDAIIQSLKRENALLERIIDHQKQLLGIHAQSWRMRADAGVLPPAWQTLVQQHPNVRPVTPSEAAP